MAEFMLLIRGDEAVNGLSDEEAKARVGEYVEWSRKLRERGLNLGGNELASDGVVLRLRDGEVFVNRSENGVAESIGGYFHIQVQDERAAVEIASECPALRFGGAVELRAIIDHS